MWRRIRIRPFFEVRGLVRVEGLGGILGDGNGWHREQKVSRTHGGIVWEDVAGLLQSFCCYHWRDCQSVSR